MVESGRLGNILRVLIVFSIITIIVGSIFIYQLTHTNISRVETQPHPLPRVPPASELPGNEVVYVGLDDLLVRLGLFVSTYHFHNGDKGTWVSLDVTIRNNGTIIIDDLCFWRITIYWADESANFTTGFTPSDNYTIDSGALISISLDGSHDWTGITENLCWNVGGQGYGRVLLSYDSNRVSILTSALISIVNAVE